MLRSMRVPGAALLLCGLGLLVAASAGAVPKPPPKFWSPARCERVMLTQHPSVSQVLCVGSGGPAHCRWTSGHRARLYSEFTVFTRVLHRNVAGDAWVEPGFVRSFTLATRARPGFGRIVHNYGDRYVGWPADFFMGNVRVLRKPPVTPAQFNSIVAPIAARLMQEETTSCTGA
jgi:hypothetical protein